MPMSAVDDINFESNEPLFIVMASNICTGYQVLSARYQTCTVLYFSLGERQPPRVRER